MNSAASAGFLRVLRPFAGTARLSHIVRKSFGGSHESVSPLIAHDGASVALVRSDVCTVSTCDLGCQHGFCRSRAELQYSNGDLSVQAEWTGPRREQTRRHANRSLG